MKNKVIGAVLALGCALPVQNAQAHRRDFPFTYDWQQPSKGEKEIELKSRYRGRDNGFQQEIEFEYGISDRLMLAPYLVFEKNGNGDLKLEAFKLEGRYQLGEYKANSWLPGLYLEYEAVRKDTDEAEGKLILSRYGKKGDDFSFNYIVERELKNGAEFENVYSFGYARSLSDKGFLARRDVRGGFEWIHNLSSGRINAGPVLGLAASKNVWLVGGWAFPVNSRGGNKSEVRLLAEYEF